MKLIIRTNKILYLLFGCLAFLLLAFLLMSAMGNVQTRETLAEWRPSSRPFEADSHSPTDYSTSNQGAELTRSNGTAVLGGAGGTVKEGPQHSYYSRGWNNGSQWWQLSGVSTHGYEQIELSFATKGSNTGPKEFTLEYSTDGSEWIQLTNSAASRIAYAIDADNKFHKHGPYLLEDGVNNRDQLHIRFLNIDEGSVIGEATKSSGTSYIADIIITGVMIEQPNSG